MAFNASSVAKVNISGQVSATTSATALTRIAGTASNGTTTLGTVGANKEWDVYAYEWVWQALGTTGSEAGAIAIGPVSQSIGYSVTSTTVDVCNSGGCTLSPNCITLTAGQTITVSTSNSGANASLVAYYKERSV